MSSENNTSHDVIDENLEAIIETKRRSIEAIFDAVPICMLLVDKNYKVARVNRAVRNMLGVDFQDIVNKPIREALKCAGHHEGDSPEQAECDHCDLIKVVRKAFDANEETCDLETCHNFFCSDEKKKLFVSLSAVPVEIDFSRFVVVSMNDITKRKIAEEETRKNVELRAQFVSTVSHELRTPMACMKESIEIVLEGTAGRVKKKQKEFLDIAYRNLERLSALIDDVLDFQKFEAGKMKLDIKQGNIEETAKHCYETMNLLAKKQKIKLKFSVDGDIPQLSFDASKITQVLTNLLSNAIKFTPAKGQVDLRITSSGDSVVLIVKDTGMGIAKEDIANIFQQFYRVKSAKHEIKGTGLGLAIVKKIILMHGGTIGVDSEVGQGTTFTVQLPIKPDSVNAE